MKYLWAIFFCFAPLYADFCAEISDDLKVILEKTEGVKGSLESVIPFPDQGGSFINQVYLVKNR